MTIDREVIEDLIQKNENILYSQESFYLLSEYISYLQKINKKNELINYINEELLKNIIFECIFGEKIYDIKEVYEFYKHHKNVIYSKTKRFFLSSRDSSILNNFYMNQNKVWDMMDISFEIILTHDFEKWEIFQNWLNDSILLLEGSELYYKKKDYKNCLRELQRSIETLAKAYALYIGLKKENQLQKKIGHNSVNVYIDLLKENWIVKAKDIFKLKTDISKSIDNLNKTKPPKINLKKIEEEDVKKLKEELIKWDQGLTFFIDKYTKIDYKIERKFARKGIRYAVNRCKRDFNTDIKSYYKSFFGFCGILLPLVIITQFYQSKFSYSDMSNKLNLKYEDLNLIKHFDEITSLLKENTEYLKQSYKKPKKASYTLLSETLKYRLEHLTLYPETNQKVELIEKIINEIKKDSYIQNLIIKIDSSEISEFITNNEVEF